MLRPRTGWSGAVLLEMPTPAGPESGALRIAKHALCNTQCLLQCLLDPPTDPRQSIGTTNAAGRNRRSKGLLKSE